jgi:protein-tyrosine kinase
MKPFTMLTTKVRGADKKIGAILVDAGRISPEDVQRILQYQRQTDIRFGEAGVALGLLTESDILHALSLQFDYPYLDAGGSQPISTEVVAAYRPFSPEGERLRALRGQLQLRWMEAGGRQSALAITSALRGEGRSRLAANLAVTFAQLGQRTLLIDGDLRQPRQHKLFKIENHMGLSNLLAGRMQDQVVTFVHGIPGLAVLPSGPPPPNPSELLSRPALPRILEQSTSTFDVVLVDTPACEVGADAVLLARAARACLALARKDETRTRDFLSTLGVLTDSGVHVVGSVLIDAHEQASAEAADREGGK